MYLLIATLAALIYTVGGIFMKLSAGFSQLLPTLMVYVLFLIGATLQTYLIDRAHMGITYIILLGLEAVCAILVSCILFKEPYSTPAMFGIFLIVAGTALLHAGKI